MYKSILKFFGLLSLSIFITACSTSVNIKSLNPSNIDKKDIGSINIENINNDTIGLKYELKKQMNALKFDDKKYFYLAKDADSSLVGEVLEKRVNRSYYFKRKRDYRRCIKYKYSDKTKKRKCIKYYSYPKACIEKEYILSVEFELYNNITKEQIFSDIFSSNKTTYHCNNLHFHNIQSHKNFDELRTNVIKKFINTIIPTYSYINVKLLDEKDIVYSEDASKLLDNSFELVEEGLYQEARELLKSLIIETNSSSYIAFYNLAVVHEVLMDIEIFIKI